AAGDVEFGRRVRPDNDIDADVLVGADGVTSVVVARLEPGLAPTYAGYTAWRGVATVAAALHDGLTASETWGRAPPHGRARGRSGPAPWPRRPGRQPGGGGAPQRPRPGHAGQGDPARHALVRRRPVNDP